MLDSKPTALSLERATLAELNAKAEKMNAETATILQETRWYPMAAIGAILVGFFEGLAGILTIAIKAMQ